MPNADPVKEVKDLGLVIRRARKETGLTQAKAAAMCGVGVRFLSELENGKATLSMGKVIQVVENFGFSLSVERKGLRNG